MWLLFHFSSCSLLPVSISELCVSVREGQGRSLCPLHAPPGARLRHGQTWGSSPPTSDKGFVFIRLLCNDARSVCDSGCIGCVKCDLEAGMVKIRCKYNVHNVWPKIQPKNIYPHPNSRPHGSTHFTTVIASISKCESVFGTFWMAAHRNPALDL